MRLMIMMMDSLRCRKGKVGGRLAARIKPVSTWLCDFLDIDVVKAVQNSCFRMGKELLQRQISKSCEGIILPFYYHVGVYGCAICRQELYFGLVLKNADCFKVGSH